MKNIIILGAPRVGKSSLASLICSKYPNINYISGDSIRNAFINIYPELNYSSKNTINKKDFCDFINFIITESNIHFKRNINYVIESADISIANAKEIFKDSVIIVIGCMGITELEMMENIKKYDTNIEWTYGYNDKELRNVCSETISKSKKLYETCKENDIAYFDTAKNRERTFEEIIQYIKTKID